ncbi:MAG: hypothetical protein ACM3SP_20095 [Chloroflexota bacterium]
MKVTKGLIAGALVVGSLWATTTPVLADYRDRRQDLRELEAARRELRSDLRRGAGRGEIAHDRAAIAQERRELSRGGNFRSWNNSWRRYDNRHYDGWNRWGRSDRGWHRGWWR